MFGQLFKEGTKFVYVTYESPQQFSGMLYVCLEGTSPETVVESVRTVSDLKSLDRLPLNSISSEWLKRFGVSEGSKPDDVGNLGNTASSKEPKVEVVKTEYRRIDTGVSTKFTMIFFMFYLFAFSLGDSGNTSLMALIIVGFIGSSLYTLFAPLLDGHTELRKIKRQW